MAGEDEPGDEPKEAEGAGGDEGGAPAIERRERRDDGRGDNGSDRGSGLDEAVDEAAVLRFKPVGDAFGGGHEVAAFAGAEEEAEAGEGPGAADEGVEHVGRAPPDHEEAKGAAGTPAVDEEAGADVHEGIGGEEGGEDVGVLLIGDRQFLREGGGEDGEGLAVDVVDDRGEKEEASDAPAPAAHL